MFSKYLCQGVPYQAENWHVFSNEQYHFLDICRCAFKFFCDIKETLWIVVTASYLNICNY